MMWEIQGKQLINDRFTALNPLKVLNYCDGPKIFTCLDSDGELCLACWSDEDEQLSRYVVVPITESIVAELEAGTLSVRDALEQPRCWTVDCAHDGSITAVWSVDLAVYPNDALPQPSVMLYPGQEPLLSVRAIGEGIQEGGIPSSVVKFTIQAAQKAIKGLIEFVLNARQIGRPQRIVQRLCDLPVTSFKFASFELAFRAPLPVPNQLPGLNDEQYRQEQVILNQAGTLLQKGLMWLASTNSEEGSLPDPENQGASRAVIRALQFLVPPSRGPITRVELRGKLIHSVGTPVRLTRASRTTVNQALFQIPRLNERSVTLVGFVKELDFDSLSFQLRGIEGPTPERTCRIDVEAWDEVHELLGEAVQVEVIGTETVLDGPIEVLRIIRINPTTLPASP
jgi:hypothetical protein